MRRRTTHLFVLVGALALAIQVPAGAIDSDATESPGGAIAIEIPDPGFDAPRIDAPDVRAANEARSATSTSGQVEPPEWTRPKDPDAVLLPDSVKDSSWAAPKNLPDGDAMSA